jgi:uncharacterized protein YaiE (UPF0345 family)
MVLPELLCPVRKRIYQIPNTLPDMKFTFTLLLLAFPFLIFSQTITFSAQRGFYSSPFQLTLTSSGGQQIRYTTNGTAPTVSTGTVYSGPISISTTSVIRVIGVSGGVATPVQTHSYIFLNDVIRQPANIAGWPNNSYALGSGNATAVHDYEMDPDVVNNPLYSADIIQGLQDIPTMSIVLDKASFQSMYDGDIEVPASAEIMYAASPSSNEQFDVGIEAHSHLRLKRSMRLTFSNSNNGTGIQSKIFKNAPLNASSATEQFFKGKIVLRAGNNRSWARNWNPDRTEYTRDEWYRNTQLAVSGTGSHGTFVHLYVNGLYWGLYNPAERPDAGYQAKYFGGNYEDWLSYDSDGVRSGDATRYNYMAGTLVNKDMTVSANYEEMKQYLDVDNFIDYLMITWMTGMTDWPNNNFQAGNRNNPTTTPTKYFAWDCEWSWDVTNGSNNGAWVHPDFKSNQSLANATSLLAKLWHSLRRNPEFMNQFANRVNRSCFNNGALTDAASISRWNTLNNFIDKAIIAESARWGDGINDGVTRTRNGHWLPEVNRVRDLMQGNVQRFINALRAEGYYPLLSAPLFSREGGVTTSGTQLTISNPNGTGTIYYTLNGNDPKAANGGLANGATAYTGAITITGESTTVKARVYDGTNWSALHEGVFFYPQLKINEFLASNSLGIVDELGVHEDWIEIYNKGSQPVDIGGMYITDLLSNPTLYQIPATDPSKTTIPANGHLLLWADNEPAQGVLHVNVKLSAGGEAIGLAMMVDGVPTYLDQITFGAQSADVSTGSFPDGSTNIRTFTTPTPGAQNVLPQLSGVYINEVVVSNTTGITDANGDHDGWIEIHNKNANPVNIGGLYFTNNTGTPLLYQFPTNAAAVTTIPANGFIILWADNQTSQGALHLPFTLNSAGGVLALVNNDGLAPAILDQLQYPSTAVNTSTGRYPDGSANLKPFATPTPSAANTLPLVSGLYINEFLASNDASNTDEFGEFEDWIEIYNSNNQPTDIGGLFITDNLANSAKWQIPTNRPDLTTIPAGGFILLYADEQPAQGPLHVNIKLSGGGEQIGLFQIQGGVATQLDGLTYTAQTTNKSEGRLPDGTGAIQPLNQLTPGASNSSVANPVPVANAGPDQTITLPVNSVILNGSGTDNGSIKTYTWTQVGTTPNIATFSSKTVANPTVSGLVAGTYTFSLVVTDNLDAPSIADQVTITVNPAAPVAVTLFRINAGGPAYTFGGVSWSADQYFTGGSTYSTTTAIAGTTNDQLYQSERWGTPSYAIPVSNGTYTLRLHFAEIFWTNPNQRVFSVNIEGGKATIPSLDIVAVAGANTAYFVEKTFTVTDGILNFNLVAGVENPKLSGIEVITSGAPVNAAPVANAGSDQTLVLPTSSTILNGSGTDDGSIKTYTWTQVGSTPNVATFSSKTVAAPTVSGLIAGTYTFSLIVTDNLDVASVADQVTITVVSNPAPVANAGADQNITLPTSSTVLNGSGTDNGSIKTYAWTQVGVTPNVASFSSTTVANPTVSGLVAGTYTFSLVVTDNLDVPSVADQVTVTVTSNPTPIANAGADQIITLPTNSIILSGSGSDNGSIKTYTWTQVGTTPNVANFSSKTVANPTVSELIAGSYTFSLIVTDNLDAPSVADQVTVTVNPAPTGGTTLFRINSGGPAYSFGGVAWSADQYFSGGSSYSATTAIAGTTNDQLYQSERWGVFSYAIPVPNGTYTLRLHFAEIFWTNPNQRVFTVNIEGGKATIPSFDIVAAAGGANTAISVDRTFTVTDGTLNFNMVAGVENPKLSGIEVISSGTPVNQAPVANAGSDQTLILPTSSTTLNGSGTDDGSIKTYTWTQVGTTPNVAVFSSKTVANPTVSGLVAGTYTFSLIVTDNADVASVADQVTVTVTTNPIPVANAGPDKNITLPTNSTVLNGSGTDNGSIKSYTWTQVGVTPNVATFSSKTVASPTVSGLIAGTYTFSLVVTDNLDAVSVADNVTVVVNPAPPAGQSVVSFTLINATTDVDLLTITNGAVLNIAALGTNNLNIRANTNPATVGSVSFTLTGAAPSSRTETVAPYALFGDNSGDYTNWALAVGSYTLTATPHTGSGGSGTAGQPLTISFTVVNQANTRSITLPELRTSPVVENWNVKAIPNPSTQHFNLKFSGATNDSVTIRVFNAAGTLVEKIERTGASAVISIGRDYRPGIYIVQVVQKGYTKNLKIVKQ